MSYQSSSEGEKMKKLAVAVQICILILGLSLAGCGVQNSATPELDYVGYAGTVAQDAKKAVEEYGNKTVRITGLVTNTFDDAGFKLLSEGGGSSDNSGFAAVYYLDKDGNVSYDKASYESGNNSDELQLTGFLVTVPKAEVNKVASDDIVTLTGKIVDVNTQYGLAFGVVNADSVEVKK